MGFLSKVFKPVGDILNGLTGVSSTAAESYDYSKQLAAQQQSNNISLWNMQNEYNTPASQLARMADAGIYVNPMTYAVGNGTMSSTAQNISPATYHAPNFGSPGNPIAMAMEVMSGIKGLERQDKENQILQKDIENYEHNHASPYKDIINAFTSLVGKVPVISRYMSDNYGKGYAEKHRPQVYDESKPALGRNLKKVDPDWKFTWWPW